MIGARAAPTSATWRRTASGLLRIDAGVKREAHLDGKWSVDTAHNLW
jgi:hypothetical protein